METISIIVHLLLIATLFYKRAWDHVPFLGLIALLGLGCTPLMHYAAAHSGDAYFYIHILMDVLMAVLYLWSIFLLYCTPLDWIGYSQVVYLTMKALAWTMFLQRQDDSATAVFQLMRPVNIGEILFWAIVILLYDDKQRRSIDAKQSDSAHPKRPRWPSAYSSNSHR
jgi:hypothetical protein